MTNLSYDLSRIIPFVKLDLLNALDKVKKRKLKLINTITCKAGCNYCCCQLVHITTAEALIIYDHLKKHQTWDEVKTKAKEQAKYINDVGVLSWFQLDFKCPILISGKCGVYEVRPIICATYFMSTNPELCNPRGVTPGVPKPIRFEDILKDFRDKIESNFPDNGVMKIKLPIQVAILFAERISIRSGLNLEKAIKLFFDELSRSV